MKNFEQIFVIILIKEICFYEVIPIWEEFNAFILPEKLIG